MPKSRPSTLPLAAALAGLVCLACSERAPRGGEAPPKAAEPGLFSATEARAFLAASAGLIPLPADGAPSLAPGPRLSALSAREAGSAAAAAARAPEALPPGQGFALALEGWGLARIDLEPGGASYRVVASPSPYLAGLAVGGMWEDGERRVLQLFRDPLAEGSGGGSPSPGGRPLLFSLGRDGLVPLDLPSLGPDLYALFPDPARPGSWLAQTRRSEGEGFVSDYLRLESLTGAASPLRRAAFEEALAPRPLGAAPAGLRESLREAAGGSEPRDFLLRLRDAFGGETWYGGGDPAEASSFEAWSAAEFLVVLAPEGRLARAEGGAVALSRPAPPVAGARFGQVAALRSPAGGLCVLGWELEGGPSGILVLPLF